MKNKYNVVFERFPTIDKLIQTNKNRKPNKVFSPYPLNSNDTSKSFSGTASYQEAEDLLVHSWDKPLDRLKGGEKAFVKSNTVAQKRKSTTGVVGYMPNVPNAVMGLPNSMINTESIKQKVKAVTIVYSPCVSYQWSTNEIIDSGIAVMNIINLLERNGIRVQLTIEFMASHTGRANPSNQLSVVWLDVKGWRDPLDLKKIAFPVVHSSMLRRIGFRWLETNPNITNPNYIGGYGTPIGDGVYTSAVQTLKDHQLLKDHEYYITAPLCKDMNFDPEKIMEKANMMDLRKGA